MAASSSAGGGRCAAIVALPGAAEGRAGYLDSLAGGGTPGRRWTLRYIAGKEALKEARQARGPEAAPSSPAWLGGVADAALPWRRLRHGLYVDAWVRAVQRFDLSTWENENGVYELLGAATCADWLRLTVHGPFKWPEPTRRAICAFQPTVARCQLGPLDWEWPLEPEAVGPSTPSPTAADAKAAPLPFEEAPVTKLPFFKFLHVDSVVAVAQGRSGSVAVWTRSE